MRKEFTKIFIVLLLSILVLSVFRAHAQVDFSKRIFQGGYDTSQTIFSGPSLFFVETPAGEPSQKNAAGGSGGSAASRKAGFSKAQFPSTASFTNDVFQGRVDCRRVYFSDDIVFNKSSFKGDADFTRDTFTSVADFSETQFQGDCHFVMASFLNYADFSRAHFRGTGYFSDLTLTDTTIFDFYLAVLPDTIDFSENPNIPLEINFSVASFSGADSGGREAGQGAENGGRARWWETRRPGRCLLFLEGSEISKFRLDYNNFQLLFTDPKTGKEISDDEKEAVYESLLKNFQDRGQLDSYKLLDIEFQDYQWGKKGPLLGWLYVFPHYWNYYGHENGLVFLWTLVFLSIFTLVSYRFLDSLATVVYPMKNISGFPTDKQIKAAATKKEKMRLSWERLWNAFVYTSVIFFLFSLDIGRFRFSHKKGAFFLLVVYTVGIICIAYMANFVITK